MLKVSCDVREGERGEGVEGWLEGRGMIGRGREGKVFKVSCDVRERREGRVLKLGLGLGGR